MTKREQYAVQKLKTMQLTDWQRGFVNDLDSKGPNLVLSPNTRLKLAEVFIEAHYMAEGVK